jgi:hypothetical protein
MVTVPGKTSSRCNREIRGIGLPSLEVISPNHNATISSLPAQPSDSPLTPLSSFVITSEAQRVSLSRPSTLLSSSMAEHSAVNRRVVGSSPTSGANLESIVKPSKPILKMTDCEDFVDTSPDLLAGLRLTRHFKTSRFASNRIWLECVVPSCL